jgi:membrane-bound ClpP family serine protease
MAIAALVLGIVAVVFALIPVANLWAPILGIAGIIIAVISRKQEKTAASLAGLILSIIGLVLGALMWIACSICAVKMGTMMQNPEFQKTIREAEDKYRKSIDDATKRLQETPKALDETAEQTGKQL